MKDQNYEEAILSLKYLILLSKRLKIEKSELEATINLGLCLFFTGKFLDSIEIFESAILLCSQSLNHSPSPEMQILKFRAYCYATLACIASSNTQEAQNYFEILLNFYAAYREQEGVGTVEKKKILSIIIHNFFGFDSVAGFIEGKELEMSSEETKDEGREAQEVQHERSLRKIIISFYNMLLNYNEEQGKEQKESVVDGTSNKAMNNENEYIQESYFQRWIDTLKTEIGAFKQSKDFHGFLFANLNHNLSLIIQNSSGNSKEDPQESKKEKNKLNSLFKILVDEFNKETDKEKNIKEDNKDNGNDSVKTQEKEKDKDNDNNNRDCKVELSESYSVQKVVSSFKSKLELSSQILKKLYSLEVELCLELNNNDNLNKSNDRVDNELSDQLRESQVKTQVIKIFIKFAINKLMAEIESTNEDFFNSVSNFDKNSPNNNNTKSNSYTNHFELIKQLEFILELIQTQNLDLSNIDLDSIDPNIFKSFRTLYRNLCLIRYKSNIQVFFKRFMLKTLGYTSRKALREFYAKQFDNFQRSKLNTIRDGMTLCKFNFSSSGTKEHFYQVCLDESCIKVFDKPGAKSFSKIYFSELRKFSFGICTGNMRKKARTKDFKDIEPWECFSVVTSSRTLDFAAGQKTVDDWFYGIKAVFEQLKVSDTKERDNKTVCSTGYYLLTRAKMKMYQQLKEVYLTESGKPKEPSHVDLKMINDMIEQVKETGIQSFSFLKVFLLLNKLKPGLIKK